MASPGDLNADDRAYYDELLKLDKSAAEGFLETALESYQLDQEVIEGTYPIDEEPTLFGTGDKLPTPTEVKAEEEAQELENLNERVMQMNPIFLDEEQRKRYDEAVDYYVRQGYPNEDTLGTQFQIEFENATQPLIFEGETYSWGGESRPEGGDFDRDTIEYDMQVLAYGSKRLENVLRDMGPEVKTAQIQAKEDLYGMESPRQPRAPKTFGGGKTPTPVGMLQQNPELAKELSLSEVAFQALLPQVIMTGEQARAEKAQRQMWVEASEPVIFDYNEADDDEEHYYGSYGNYLDDWEEMTKTDISQMLYRQEVGGFDRLLTMDADERAELDEIYKQKEDIAAALARKAVREKIKDLYKYSELFREELEPDTLDSLLEEYPAPDEGVIQNTLNTVGEVFSQLTTAESPEDRQRLYRMGIAPDPDAITETMSMAALRDLNLPLRLAINPLLDQAENFGLIERFDPLEEKETWLPAERIELTEDSSLLGLPSAYLKEALVDTATMRGLGNDFAQIKSITFIPGGTYIGADIDLPDEVRNGMVVAGTLAEFLVPFAPKVKGLGSLAQGTVKAFGAGTKTQTATRWAVNALSAGDFGSGLATMGGELLTLGGKNVARNLAFSRVGGVGTATKFSRADRISSLNDSATFSSNIADNVSESILELEVRRRYTNAKPDQPDAYRWAGSADDFVDEMYRSGVIKRPRFEGETQAWAQAKFDEALKSKSPIIRNTAEYYNSRNTRWSEVLDDEYQVYRFTPRDQIGGGYYGLGDDFVEAARVRAVGGRQPTMEIMRGTWLDDSIRATDRMIVSEEFMKRAGNEAIQTEFGDGNKFVVMRNGKPDILDDGSVLVNSEHLFGWAENYFKQGVQPFRLNANDTFLNGLIEKITKGERLTANEFIYFNNRIVEEILFEASEGTAVKITKDPDILTRATEAPIQRSLVKEVWRGYGSTEAKKGLTFFKNFSDKYIRRLSKEQIKINKRNRATLEKIGADSVDSRNFIDQVESAIVRTGKTSQQTIQHVAREVSDIDLWRMDDAFEGMKPAERTYTVMLSLQAVDYDFARIGSMKGGAMSLDINRVSEVIPGHPIPGTTRADVAIRNLLGLRAGAMRTSPVVQEFINTRVVGSRYVDVNQYFKLADDMVDEFPELGRLGESTWISKKKWEPLNAALMQKEIRLQYYKAIEDNFLHRGLSEGANTPAMSKMVQDARTGAARPVVASVAKQNELIDEFVRIRLTVTDELARTEAYRTILVREGLIKAPTEPRGRVVPEVVPEDWAKISPKEPTPLKSPQYKPPKQRPKEKPDTYQKRLDRYDEAYNQRVAAVQAKNVKRNEDWITEYNRELDAYEARYDAQIAARERAVEQSAQMDVEDWAAYDTAVENMYIDTKTYVDLISDGAVEHVENYARGLGLQLDRLPHEVISDVRFRLDSVLEGKGNILLSPKEVDILADVRARLGNVDDVSIFQGNLMAAKAKQYGRYGQDAMDYATYGLEGWRRLWTQGQLGGKVLPNPTYILENQLTATLITYVTNPKYIADVLPQTFKTLGGRTPYRQLRNLAMEAPNQQFGKTRYTNKQMFDMYNQYNLGTSSAGINLGPNFRNDMVMLAGSSPLMKGQAKKLQKIIGYDPLDIMSTGKQAVLPNTTSPWMRFADDADRAFREAIFIRGIEDGLSPQAAALQAQRVLLDYGKMPQWMRKGFGRMALYFSFTYMTGIEMFRAMATAKGMQRVSALANFNRQQMRHAGVWFGADNRSVEPLFYNVVQDEEGKDTDRAYAYIRAPYVGNIAALGELGGSLWGQLSGRAEPATIEDFIVGTQKFLYVPAFDLIKGMLYRGRRTVPKNLLKEMADESGPYTSYQLTLDLLFGNGGANPYAMYDRYKLAVRTPDEEKPGRPSIGGKQYYFRDSEGYNNYLEDQFVMNSLGINRTISEITNGLIQGGLIDVPEDYYMDFDDRGIPRMFLYYGARERPIRLPKEDEMRYRAFKQSLKGLKLKRQDYK